MHATEAPPQPPTVPLVPRGASKSDKGDPVEHYPAIHRTIPVAYSKPPKKRSCFCRCLCWTVCLLILQIIVIAVFAGIIFLVFQPKLPKYSVDSLRITQFNLTNDMNLNATFNVNITATNPNKKIGSPEHDGDGRGSDRTNTERNGSAVVAGGSTADRKYSFESPGEGASEDQAVEVEADEGEVLGEVQSGSGQPNC
ncbi:hypothetical protein F0562_006732 [Nyssa sinensis]|uniref:Late embryogenesis abundant protein LEA-2 subgroup domain-containing protein n=1 Tax=Nyssa sinensis TaxID=561372 RepID=A0A5J5AQQ7_9ASTE|nr:hypothetical protein F0562_006732 [Nyssa sinensis]